MSGEVKAMVRKRYVNENYTSHLPFSSKDCTSKPPPSMRRILSWVSVEPTSRSLNEGSLVWRELGGSDGPWGTGEGSKRL
jgi:hypothetical protein